LRQMRTGSKPRSRAERKRNIMSGAAHISGTTKLNSREPPKAQGSVAPLGCPPGSARSKMAGSSETNFTTVPVAVEADRITAATASTTGVMMVPGATWRCVSQMRENDWSENGGEGHLCFGANVIGRRITRVRTRMRQPRHDVQT
jgi:hypothetical protein